MLVAKVNKSRLNHWFSVMETIDHECLVRVNENTVNLRYATPAADMLANVLVAKEAFEMFTGIDGECGLTFGRVKQLLSFFFPEQTLSLAISNGIMGLLSDHSDYNIRLFESSQMRQWISVNPEIRYSNRIGLDGSELSGAIKAANKFGEGYMRLSVKKTPKTLTIRAVDDWQKSVRADTLSKTEKVSGTNTLEKVFAHGDMAPNSVLESAEALFSLDSLSKIGKHLGKYNPVWLSFGGDRNTPLKIEFHDVDSEKNNGEPITLYQFFVASVLEDS